MLFEPGTIAQPLKPSLQVLQRRPLDRKSVPSVNQGSQRDLGETQLITGEKGAVRERVVRNRPGGERLSPSGLHRRVIQVLRPRPDQSEQQRTHWRADAGELPVHPSLDMSPRLGVARIELLAV